MPCNDGGSGRTCDGSCNLHEVRQLKRVEAMLCALSSTLERRGVNNQSILNLDKLLDLVDWKEAGITRKEFDDWWMHHKIQDSRRRKLEREELHRQNDIKAAKAKLTEREKKLLGIR